MPAPELAPVRRALRVTTLPLLPLLVVGCIEPPVDPEPDPEPTVVVPDPVEEEVTAQGGGRVVIGDTALEIPAGAVQGDVTIEVEAVDPADLADELPAEGDVEGLVYDFGPDGLAFDEPADLALPLPEDEETPTSFQVAYLDETTGVWVGVPTLITAGTATAKIHHFTKYAVVQGLESSCGVQACGESADLEGLWHLVDDEVGGCAFAESPPASCVTHFYSSNYIKDATLLFGDTLVNGTFTLSRDTRYLVPGGCEQDAFGAAFGGESCASAVDGGIPDGSEDFPTVCPRIDTDDDGLDDGCYCDFHQDDVTSWLAGEITATEDGKLVLTWEDEETGIEEQDQLYFCRDGDFLTMYGVAQGHTMALEFVRAGSPSDTQPPPLDAPYPRAGTQTFSYIPMGSGLVQFFYAHNASDQPTNFEVEARGDDGTLYGPVPLNVSSQPHSVVSLGSSIQNALSEAGFGYTTEKASISLTSAADINLFGGYNSRGDRVAVPPVTDDEGGYVHYLPYIPCGPGIVEQVHLYNPTDEEASYEIVAQLLDSGDAWPLEDMEMGVPSDLEIGTLPGRGLATLTNLCPQDGLNRKIAVAVSADTPIIVDGFYNARSDRVRYRAFEEGRPAWILPQLTNSSGTTRFMALQNLSDEPAEVTLDWFGAGTATVGRTASVSIPAGESVRVKDSDFDGDGDVGGTLRITQSETDADLAPFFGFNARGNRAVLQPYGLEELADEWVVPFMPYGAGITQIIHATSEEEATLSVEAVDRSGAVYGPVELDLTLLGGWESLNFTGAIRAALYDLGADLSNARLGLRVRSDGAPFALHAGYNTRGDRVVVRVVPPRVPCNSETSQDSDNDGALDCAEACPDDPNKLLPGACGCGEEEVDPCPAPLDAGVVTDGGFAFDGGAPDDDGGFDVDAGAPDDDAGVYDDDAGMSYEDAGAPTDAGPPDFDAGSPTDDAGMSFEDAGAPADAGAPDTDAGDADAGQRPREWVCSPSYQSDSDCDCGCGDSDPACGTTEPAQCDYTWCGTGVEGESNGGSVDASDHAFCQPPEPLSECSSYGDQSSCDADGQCLWANDSCGYNPDTDCGVLGDQTDCNAHTFCYWNGQGCATGGATCDQYPTESSCASMSPTCSWNGSACEEDAGAGCDVYPDQPTCEADVNCDWEGMFQLCGDDPFGPDDCSSFNGDQFGCEAFSGCLYNTSTASCHDSCYQFGDASTCAGASSCGWNDSEQVCEPGGGAGGSCDAYFDEFSCYSAGCEWDFFGFTCTEPGGGSCFDYTDEFSCNSAGCTWDGFSCY